MALPGVKPRPSITCFHPAKTTGEENIGAESTSLLHLSFPICSKTVDANQKMS